MSKKHTGPKVLLIDIETSPLITYTWGLFDQNIGLNQIKDDWNVLSWSAKWLHDPDSKIMYADLSKSKDVTDDKKLMEQIWKLLDESDYVIGHNSKAFDTKKLNARFAIHGLGKPKPYQEIDTLSLARKYFKFTSNKLEYIAEALKVEHKKMKDRKFSGFELWKACLAKNKEAWKEMQAYNKRDVLALQGVYKELCKWDESVDVSTYHDEPGKMVCICGSESFTKNGFRRTKTSKKQRYCCDECGTPKIGTVNLLKKKD